MLQKYPIAAMALLIIALPAVGRQAKCDDPESGMVQGKVILEGQPLAKGKITFHPKEGKPIEVEIKDGDYRAKDMPVGKMPVTVEGEGVPKSFAQVKTTPLQIEVIKGNQQYDFDLKK
jgi:hypothetical protein